MRINVCSARSNSLNFAIGRDFKLARRFSPVAPRRFVSLPDSILYFQDNVCHCADKKRGKAREITPHDPKFSP